jgi:hypothetical protein
MMSMIISFEASGAGLFFGSTPRSPSTVTRKQPVDQEKQARQQRKAVIGKYVIDTLGQPHDLHGVQVRYLWEDHYRVNVLIGVDAASAKVAHSYFLVADSDGNILASTPKITRQY